MGAGLGMPLAVFISKLTAEPLSFLKTLFVFWWFRIFGQKKKRFDLYDPADGHDLTKTGAYIPPVEYQLEMPQDQLQKHESDAVLLYGCHSSGARLVANVCRDKEGHVAWFYLRMPDGKTYQPTTPDVIYPPSGNFFAGGLRIKCIMPMRKWRVSFNGILREVAEGEKDTRLVHVKFAFLWMSSSFPFDLSADIHPLVVAEYVASQSTIPSPSKCHSVSKSLDAYVQAGSLFGTVSVDGSDDTEMFLWGARKRSKHNILYDDSSHRTELIAYSKDGQLIYSGEYELPGFKGKLNAGFYLERSTLSWPVTSCRQQILQQKGSFPGMNVNIQTERSSASVNVDPSNNSLQSRGINVETKVYSTLFQLQDGDAGHAIFLESTCKRNTAILSEKQSWIMPKPDLRFSKSSAAILSLDEVPCLDSNLTGGKGASLAALTQLASKYKTDFRVPEGFVLTTTAYKSFYESTGVHTSVAKLQENAWSYQVDQIKEISQEIVSNISNRTLSSNLKSLVQKQLSKTFHENGASKRFAVRSSASGEDSEEMSAAGQMSTFLGVQGFENIFKAVVKCWASQFSFTAIQYKRQNGQELNSSMAVVVQEMVPAESAGVLFTCDPVTGNPQNITITANYGLGESVVSASADPDTIVLKRDEHNHVTLSSVQTGSKKTKVIMIDDGSVQEEEVEETSAKNCCLSEKKSLLIAETGIKIEGAYGFPVDIEWAWKDDQLYMLQARPVTTFDSETRLEVEYACSTATRCEDEYNTKANVGEVMPGFFSHFGLSFMEPGTSRVFEELYGSRNKYAFPFNPYYKLFSTFQNHFFLNFPNFILRFYQKGEKSFLSEASIVAFFGRILEDEEIYNQADKRCRSYPSTSSPKQALYFIKDLIFCERHLKKCIETSWNREFDLRRCSNSKEMLDELWWGYFKDLGPDKSHMECTMASTIYNNLIMGILAEANKGWGVNVYSDFALILSSCGNLESADIPRSVTLLATEIRKSIDTNKFKEMSPEEALDWLESTKSSAGTAYAGFLKKHGHRCLREFDMYSKPWRMDRIPLVKILQDSVTSTASDNKTFISVKDVIKQLQVPLTWKTRLLLRILIPLCRRGVFNREMSKSLVVKAADKGRKAAWTMAEQMVKESRLPEKELMFFLTTHELAELVVTRSATLVQRAQRRKNISGDLDKLHFPEITKGIPIALNRHTNVLKAEDYSSDLEITGTPVSRGVVKAYARVATSLNEAANIKHGEILIAYSTDIAWSPYFPHLSGVATELGGLISHGAVVAREYGLPCVVGVHGATLKFRTGDYVLLDGNKGIIRRIQAPQNE